MATFSPVTKCVPTLTYPKVPFPRSLPAHESYVKEAKSYLPSL